jgi:ankyrin repeat protein
MPLRRRFHPVPPLIIDRLWLKKLRNLVMGDVSPVELSEIVANNNVERLCQLLPRNKDMIVKARLFQLLSHDESRKNKTEKSIMPSDQLSLLHVAAYYDNFEIFCLLESLGIPLRVPSGASYFPLHYACFGRAMECAAYILERDPKEATLEHDCEYQPIYLATFSNSPQILEMLLDCHANLESGKTVENGPLVQAIKSGHTDCLLILLQHRCRTDVRHLYLSPLMLAVNFGMESALEPLLDLGQDPNYFNVNGETVLSIACTFGDLAAVKLLCSRMSIIEIPATEAKFPSIARYAIRSKNLEILEIVLSKGCDVNRYDRYNGFAADAILGFVPDDVGVKMLELLIQNGFEVNCRDPVTDKALLDRVLEFTPGGYLKVMNFLLSHGADAKYVTGQGFSVLKMVRSWMQESGRYISVNKRKIFEILARYYPEDLS